MTVVARLATGLIVSFSCRPCVEDFPIRYAGTGYRRPSSTCCQALVRKPPSHVEPSTVETRKLGPLSFHQVVRVEHLVDQRPLNAIRSGLSMSERPRSSSSPPPVWPLDCLPNSRTATGRPALEATLMQASSPIQATRFRNLLNGCDGTGRHDRFG